MRVFQNILVILALAVVFAPLILAWFFWQWSEARRRPRRRVTRSTRTAEAEIQ